MHNYSIGDRKVLQTYDVEGHNISFVEIPASEKVALASDEKLVQEWINQLHRKAVKPDDIKYVLAAAKRAFSSPDPVASATYSKKPKKDATIVTIVNKICQGMWGEGLSITYDMDLSIPHSPSIKADMKLPNGAHYPGWGSSQREARIDAADKAYAALQDRITDEDCEDDDDDEDMDSRFYDDDEEDEENEG